LGFGDEREQASGVAQYTRAGDADLDRDEAPLTSFDLRPSLLNSGARFPGLPDSQQRLPQDGFGDSLSRKASLFGGGVHGSAGQRSAFRRFMRG
jgi:hypothetical protein